MLAELPLRNSVCRDSSRETSMREIVEAVGASWWGRRRVGEGSTFHGSTQRNQQTGQVWTVDVVMSLAIERRALSARSGERRRSE